MSESWCCRCRAWYPLENFRIDPERGRPHSYCRRCVAECAREWRGANPASVAAYNRERREAYAEARGSLERTCVNPDCSRTFTAGRIDQRTCSRTCRDRLAYLRRKGTPSRTPSSPDRGADCALRKSPPDKNPSPA